MTPFIMRRTRSYFLEMAEETKKGSSAASSIKRPAALSAEWRAAPSVKRRAPFF
ncbi:MAG TPA: hypothetical protein PKI76_02810 [Oscillospiraceae bacterium]|nr:hypothetical protein [Oscillospiraceae bacterium]HNW04299.1 hypothetical protein [Oscillospiraceae bacterium]